MAAIDRVVRAAYNALSRKHGFAEIPPGRVNPFYAFALVDEDQRCWVAEESGAIVGVSIHSMYRPAWFLAYLFVDPTCQAAGVGRQLLARALADGGRDATIRSLITLAYNPVSIGLYLRHGMLPQEPIYVFEAPAAELRQRLARRPMVDFEVLAPGPGAEARLAAIEGPLLEMSRESMHRYLLHVPGNVCRLFFRAGGEARGYAYVSPSGRVGPIAAMPPLPFERVLEAALAGATASSEGGVSVLLAGTNARALTLAAELGRHISQPLLLVASRRFGDFSRYAFHSAGVM
ncbi:MAG TPA: GNAT family N-acetyltransferase [Stellaceae bacterium]|nr:GNAT family N-acetyltransferase [Stellaceae bacterium]